jgi:hypothetical protein
VSGLVTKTFPDLLSSPPSKTIPLKENNHKFVK